MLTNIRKNCMGTVSFDAKFNGMRKLQDFIVYPINTNDPAKSILIQSDTRMGQICLSTGVVCMSKSHASGAYGVHLAEAMPVGALSSEDLLMLKASIMTTASGKAGTNGIVYCDNSAALDVFQVV